MRIEARPSDKTLIVLLLYAVVIGITVGLALVIDGDGDTPEAIAGLFMVPIALGALIQVALPAIRDRTLRRVRRYTGLGWLFSLLAPSR